MTAFSSIRGHDGVRELLQRSARCDRLAHALLFVGIDGVGKKLMANALGKWLFCEREGDDACGECPSCLQFESGSHPDLQVVSRLEGKKEIGVAQAREIKRNVHLRPVRADRKLIIIDDADKLNVAAQNALLKTLEDPPGHVILILICAHPESLLSTVRSRCQRIAFALLSPEHFKQVLAESCGIEAAEAEALLPFCEGSVSRALAMHRCFGDGFDQTMAEFAKLSDARYVQMMELAKSLGSPESDASAKVELLQAMLRNECIDLALSADPAAEAQLGSLIEESRILVEAKHTLDRRNPNRQLFLESLLLRLARQASSSI